MMRRAFAVLTLSFSTVAGVLPCASMAQGIDMSHGEQVHISSAGPQTYDHDAQTVTFVDRARAIRGDVTVDADQLVGFLRKKAPAPGETAQPDNKGQNNDTMGGSMELYRMEAIGHVHIYTQTDQAWGDKALYDIDQATLVMTGKNLRLTTPQDVMTARDVMEYHSQTRMSVGRGDATVTTNDGRRVRADVLVAFSAATDAPPNKTGANDAPTASHESGNPLSSGSSKLERAYGWGHVLLRTPNETATGDRGVYIFATEMARLIGHVHVTSGQNQNSGASALVNMKTGVAIMNPAPGQRIEGLVIPNDAGSSKPGDAK